MSTSRRRSSVMRGVELTSNPAYQPIEPATEQTTASENAPTPPPMLSTSQLADLFSRLDNNKDGSLSLGEILGIVKIMDLNAFIGKADVSAIFKKVDNKNTGALTLNQFRVAYQEIYAFCAAKGQRNKNAKKSFSSGVTDGKCFRATRYGHEESGKYIFEVYTYTDDNSVEEKIVVNGLSSKDDFKSSEDNQSQKSTKPNRTFDMYFQEAVKEREWKSNGLYTRIEDTIKRRVDGELEEKLQKDANLDTQKERTRIEANIDKKLVKEQIWLADINQMIFDDSTKNNEARQIFWWVDASYTTVSSDNLLDLCNAFGLPNEPSFREKFDAFDSATGQDSERISIGNGVAANGERASQSVFVSTSYLKNRPLAFALPTWLEGNFFFNPNVGWGIGTAMAEYYRKTFMWLFNLTSFSGTRSEERLASYIMAEELANRLRKEHKDEKASMNDAKGSFKHGMPAPPQQFPHKAPPTWVMSKNEIGENIPTLGFKTLSLHFLNSGFGPNCLITIREIETEKIKEAVTLDQKSSLGQLGRIMSGVWRKLFNVTAQAGCSSNCGELDDSSGALAVFIISMIHHLSLGNMQSINNWMEIVDDEINDHVAVSKHKLHAQYIDTLVKSFETYVFPVHDVFADLLAQANKAKEDTVREYEDGKKVKAAALVEKSKSGGGAKVAAVEGSDDLDSIFNIEISEEIVEKRKSGTAFSVIPQIADVPVEISYETCKHFWGDNSKQMARDIAYIVEGNGQLGTAGLKYWKSRLGQFHADNQDILDGIADRFAEKRDFISFTFTIVSVILAPAAILTGYFGMNFDNMAELSEATYPFPSTPGIQLLWVSSAVIYFSMILICLHYNIFYSST